MAIKYAFWEYDRYPFVLSGEVSGTGSEGRVTIKGYGGMLFRPLRVISKESRFVPQRITGSYPTWQQIADELPVTGPYIMKRLKEQS